MGRKSSAKGQTSGPSVPAERPAGLNPWLLGTVLAGIVGVAVLAFWSGDEKAAAPPAEAAHADHATDAPPAAKGADPTPDIVAATAASAAFGPHKQASFPPIPFRGYAPPRPPEVVTAAYQFTAEHPEISSYIPCFCGCQHSGHKGNTDCFVRSRAANGDVIEWEEHGVECAVCIDVATRSRQMHASGASVQEIRTAIEKEFGPSFPTMTPTPKPPASTHDH